MGSTTLVHVCSSSLLLRRLSHSFHAVDAKISFNQGLTVVWAGKPIGNMKLTDVDVVGDVGAVLDVETTFDVTDVDHITEFTKVDIRFERTFERPLTCANPRFYSQRSLSSGRSLAIT